jgi:ribonuclease HI
MTEEISKIIYCDGSSLGNPGAGGWGVLILKKNEKYGEQNTNEKKYKVEAELGGGEKNTTNNKMELQALIEVLKYAIKNFDHNLKIELRLDSQYVINGATLWYKNWVKNNWKKADKKEVLNKEYWKEIISLLEKIKNKNITIKWTHVYGHTGEKGNERVDVIAKSWAEKYK